MFYFRELRPRYGYPKIHWKAPLMMLLLLLVPFNLKKSVYTRIAARAVGVRVLLVLAPERRRLCPAGQAS